MNVRVTTLAIGLAVVAGHASISRAQELTGAGSSFANPLYSRWADDYQKSTGIKVNYQSIGSGAGIRQFSEMTVDFGGTDAPMSDDQISKAKGGALLHIPVAMGASVVVYNLPSIKKELRMNSGVLADIFLGKVTKWSDPALAKLNPGVALPSDDILVVHRSDGSGTTFVWTDFLTATSPEWAKQVGKGTDVKWPVGLGGKGNDGVAGQVKQLPGSIGYVELAYARQNHLAYAQIQNAAGKFITPSISSVTAAAAGVAKSLPANTDFRISIINAPGKDAYPISSMTWALVYEHQSDPAKGRSLINFLKYGISPAGQAAAETLDYAPLPKNVVTLLGKRLAGVQNVAAK